METPINERIVVFVVKWANKKDPVLQPERAIRRDAKFYFK